MRGFRRIAGKLERKVRLHARADIQAAAVEQRPPAVRPLQPPQINRDFGFESRVGLAQEVLQYDVLRRNGRVGFELENPMTIRTLPLHQRGGRRLDGAVETRLRRADRYLARNEFGVGRQPRLTR